MKETKKSQNNKKNFFTIAMGRNNDTNLWAPPVPGLDFDIEGPTADHLIDTSDIYGQTVYEHIHASKEEWTIVDKK